MKIAITSRTELLDQQNKTYVNTSYLNALKNFDVDVFILPDTINDYDAVAELFDGLIVTGGYDVNPTLYHRENTLSSGINDVEDANDIQLILSFEKNNKPILGICRGLQIINVAFGGSLIQDIPSEYSNTINHNSREDGHTITFIDNSILNKIMNGYSHVNSFHHQAIDKIANGFVISAQSSDGIIEGIEKDNILAVQWHPERMIHIPEHKAIFEYFITSCNQKSNQ